MILTQFIAALIVAVVIALIFYFGFRRTGPWRSFWSFLLIIFLAIWMAATWFAPLGPVYWDIAWIPLVFVGLVIALLLAAATPRSYESPRPATEEAREGAVAVGLYFWLVILLFIIAIGFGLMQ